MLSLHNMSIYGPVNGTWEWIYMFVTCLPFVIICLYFFPILFIWPLCFVHLTQNRLEKHKFGERPIYYTPRILSKGPSHAIIFWVSGFQKYKFKIKKGQISGDFKIIILLLLFTTENLKFENNTANKCPGGIFNFQLPVVYKYHPNLHLGEKNTTNSLLLFFSFHILNLCLWKETRN